MARIAASPRLTMARRWNGPVAGTPGQLSLPPPGPADGDGRFPPVGVIHTRRSGGRPPRRWRPGPRRARRAAARRREVDGLGGRGVRVVGEVALAPASQLAVEPVKTAFDRQDQPGLVPPRLLEVLAIDRPQHPAAHGRRARRKADGLPLGISVAPGSPAARIAARNAAVAPAARPSGSRPARAPPARHSADVGRRSTSARLRPHAAQNTPTPGGSPQKGQTRALGSTPGCCQPCAP